MISARNKVNFSFLHIILAVSMLTFMGLVLGACGGPPTLTATEAAPAETEQVIEEVAPTEIPPTLEPVVDMEQIVDTLWILVGYGDAVNPTVVERNTVISLVFNADGQVSGSAGCNNYSGTLTPVSDYFEVGPIVTTRQFCSAPAGVMEQEQVYLTALEATGGYEWEQTLRDGALVTEGRLFYFMPNGQIGALNFTTSP